MSTAAGTRDESVTVTGVAKVSSFQLTVIGTSAMTRLPAAPGVTCAVAVHGSDA